MNDLTNKKGPIMKTESINQPGPSSMKAPSNRHGYFRNRLQNFGLTMVVMGISFGLYYLGFFGGVPGPLSPGHIGDVLSGMGIADRHLLILCLSLTAVALTWNWLYNAVGRLLHRNSGGAGYRIPEFQFRVIKKGTVGHFMWMMFLVFSIIILYHM